MINLTSKSNTNIEEVKIYRNASLTPYEDKKGFNHTIHSNEPLGIKILQNCSIEILIDGENLIGNASVKIHNVKNLRNLKTISVNTWTEISISEIGGLFIDVQNIKNKLNIVEEKFSFSIKLKMNKGDYKIISTFDMRENKISEKTLSKNIFCKEAFSIENGEDPALLIADNVRIYIPLAKHLIERNNTAPIDAEEILRTHEEVICYYNYLAGLNEKNINKINRPRKGFFLVSARDERVGYLSAGGEMLDTHPSSIFEYFKDPLTENIWGMYHEYGHLFEQGWGFVEYWNNMFANSKRRIDLKNPDWAWIYGNDRQKYEENAVINSYSDYLIKGEEYKRIHPMYFFLSFIDNIDNQFMQNIETFWREEGKYSGWNFIAYFIAKKYKLNVIPFIKVCGVNQELDYTALNEIIDLSQISYLHMNDGYWFDSLRNISIPPTTKRIYSGKNKVLTGIANPKAEVEIKLNQNSYKTTANLTGHFSIVIPETIHLNSNFKIKSTEENKSPSSEVNIDISDENPKVYFKGYNNEIFLQLEFDFINKSFVSLSSGKEANGFSPGPEYIVIEHYNKKNRLKNRYSLAGNSNSDYISKLLNQTKFINGDYLKFKHREQASRLAMIGDIINAPEYFDFGVKNLNLEQTYFYLLNNTLFYSETLLELKINIDDLIEFVKECNYDRNNYTEHSYNNYVTVLEKAIEIIEKLDSTEEEIGEVYINLEKSIKNLREKNKIIFKGYDNINFLELTFNYDSMKFEAEGTSTVVHPYQGNKKYAEIKIFNKKGIIKSNYSINANQNSIEFANALNSISFEETDYIKLYHLEKNKRLVIEGFVENTPYNLADGCYDIDLENSYFYILNENLKYSNIQLDLSDDKSKLKEKIEEYSLITPEKYTKISYDYFKNHLIYAQSMLNIPNLTEVEINLEIKQLEQAKNNLREKNKIIFKGYDNINFLELTFNYDSMKFEAEGINTTIHPYHSNNKYAAITLFNKKGIVKYNYSINANQNSVEFANALNNISFEKTDYIKLHHLEKNKRLVIEGFVENTPYNLADGCYDIDLENSYFYILNENLKYFKEDINNKVKYL